MKFKPCVQIVGGGGLSVAGLLVADGLVGVFNNKLQIPLEIISTVARLEREKVSNDVRHRVSLLSANT